MLLFYVDYWESFQGFLGSGTATLLFLLLSHVSVDELRKILEVSKMSALGLLVHEREEASKER